MTSADVTILDSTTITLENGIYLTGLGDDHLYDGTLAKLSESVPDDALHIVLAHEPQYLEEEYTLSSPDLIITGHAHGGQVRLPFIGAVIVPSKFRSKYAKGVIKENGNIMIITQGLGNSILPFRFNCSPEIVLIEF